MKNLNKTCLALSILSSLGIALAQAEAGESVDVSILNNTPLLLTGVKLVQADETAQVLRGKSFEGKVDLNRLPDGESKIQPTVMVKTVFGNPYWKTPAVTVECQSASINKKAGLQQKVELQIRCSYSFEREDNSDCTQFVCEAVEPKFATTDGITVAQQK